MLDIEISDPTAWGTFLSGLGTLVLALIGLALLAYDLKLRRRQLSETRARAHSALEVELRTSMYYRIRGDFAKFEPVLETRVLLKNISSEIWAVPLVYVQARAVPQTTNTTQAQTLSEWDFADLRECGPLSRPLNIARFPNTLFYIPPGESESVVRWDALTEDFARDFPLIVIKLEVFSVPDKVMGASYSSGSGEKRARWLRFIEEDNGARHHKVVVSVSSKNISGGPKRDSWAFLKKDSDELDEESSRNFRDVLARMSKTGRQGLVAIGDELSRRRGISSFPDSSDTREAITRAEVRPDP